MNKSNCLRIILSCMCVLPFTLQATWHECCCPNFDYSYNPPLPEPTPSGKVFVEGEWLIMRSNLECGEWAWVSTYTFDQSTVPGRGLAIIDERELSHKWNSGFRVGLGYDFDCDKWGVRATYTYYNATAHDNIAFHNDLDKDGVLVGNYTDIVNAFYPAGLTFLDSDLGSFDQIPVDTKATANWKTQLNQIDLDFTREYLVGRYVSFRPVIGLRYYSLNNNFDTTVAQTFRDGQELSASINEDNGYATKASLRFHAFGIKTGFNAQYEIACGFGIYGEGYLTLAYGQFRSKTRSAIVYSDLNPTVRILAGYGVESCNTWTSVKPVADSALGIYWRTGFNCDRALFEVRAAWENHVFFNHNQFRGVDAKTSDRVVGNTGGAYSTSVITSSRCSDISLNGFALMLGVWY